MHAVGEAVPVDGAVGQHLLHLVGHPVAVAVRGIRQLHGRPGDDGGQARACRLENGVAHVVGLQIRVVQFVIVVFAQQQIVDLAVRVQDPVLVGDAAPEIDQPVVQRLGELRLPLLRLVLVLEWLGQPAREGVVGGHPPAGLQCDNRGLQFLGVLQHSRQVKLAVRQGSGRHLIQPVDQVGGIGNTEVHGQRQGQ